MNGARVGITGTRRAEQQAALVRALGGVPVHGPSVDLDVPASDAALRAAVAPSSPRRPTPPPPPPWTSP